MRVLWLSVTPSLYSKSEVAHRGGGWIEALERAVRTISGVELAVAFEHADRQFRVEKDGVCYYPIPVNRGTTSRFVSRLWPALEEKNLIQCCLRIVSDFEPDVIHVFGSEWSFGLVAQYTPVPVVIHMQGSLPAYYNARLPPGLSTFDVLTRLLAKPGRLVRYAINDVLFRLRAEREKRVLAGCRYFMGRTKWDRAIVTLYQPQAQYFHCDEMLRPEFYAAHGLWRDDQVGRMRVVSVVSAPLYKGVDLILKAAYLLKHHASVEFEWSVYGVTDAGLQEAVTGHRANQVDVRLMGVASPDQIRAALCEATVFVHPSYIENSPNSICEAQMIGVPVVATNVGGVGSLVDDGVSGVLVPANDPHMLAFELRTLWLDKVLRARLGAEGCRRAAERHSPERIISDLMSIYRRLAAAAI